MLEIFDRTEIVSAVKAHCCGESASSSVIVSTHITGKSHILRHITTAADWPNNVLVCPVAIAAVIGSFESDRETDRSVREPRRTADQWFLYFVFDRLIEELTAWFKANREESSRSMGRIAQIDAIIDHLDPSDPVERVNIEQLRKERDTYVKLRDAIAEISIVIAELESIVSNSALPWGRIQPVLSRLHRLERRVVVVVDDYHLMVTESPFTEALFKVLKGWSDTGQIVVVASSTSELTDRALHNGASQRPKWFEHFQHHKLKPFTTADAKAFLNWNLPPGQAPLDAQELPYLLDLSGGSPRFLRDVREAFLKAGRPADVAARQALECELRDTLQPACDAIWRRGTDLLQRHWKLIAANRAAEIPVGAMQQLVTDGYVSGGKLFSRIFADFVSARDPDPPAHLVNVTLRLKHMVLPTALLFTNVEEELAEFEVDNRTDAEVHVRLSCAIDVYGPPHPFVQELSVPARKKSQHSLRLPLVGHEVTGLRAPTPGVVRLKAELLDPLPQQSDWIKCFNVKLLPIDNFTFARKEPGRERARERIMDYTWLIAAWVQHTDDCLQVVLDKVRDRRKLVGYREGAAAVEPQVDALYGAVKDHGLRYDNQMTTFYRSDRDYVQRVRMINWVVRNKAANCLEGAVLFASLLSNADLNPVIFFMPGHAIVGWRTGDAPNAPIQYLDTTNVEHRSFKEACADGMSYFKQYGGASSPGHVAGEIANPATFATVVDIRQTRDRYGLVPLPFNP